MKARGLGVGDIEEPVAFGPWEESAVFGPREGLALRERAGVKLDAAAFDFLRSLRGEVDGVSSPDSIAATERLEFA